MRVLPAYSLPLAASFPSFQNPPTAPSTTSASVPPLTPSPVNMDYYMSTHMPLVQKNWTGYGLKSWKVIKFGDDAPYCVQATLEWGGMSDFQKAATSESAKTVLGDVPNFSDKDPILISGDEVGTS